jgi:cytochrome b561
MTSDRSIAAAPPRYDAVAILFHWLTALLIGTVYVFGQLRSIGGWHTLFWRFMVNTHVALGLALGAVIVLRLIWRASRRAPEHEQGLMGLAAYAGHIVLYVLMVATVALGILLKWQGGHPISFFGLFDVPALVNVTLVSRYTLFSMHAFAANGIVIVVGLHAAAALLHHYVLRDEVLHRMIPFSWRLPRSRRVMRWVVQARRAWRLSRSA